MKNKKAKGLATICIGGGEASAIIVKTMIDFSISLKQKILIEIKVDFAESVLNNLKLLVI